MGRRQAVPPLSPVLPAIERAGCRRWRLVRRASFADRVPASVLRSIDNVLLHRRIVAPVRVLHRFQGLTAWQPIIRSWKLEARSWKLEAGSLRTIIMVYDNKIDCLIYGF